MLLKISVSLAGAHSLLLGFYANLPLKNYILAVIYSSIQAIPHWKGPKIPFQKNYFGLRKPIIFRQKQNIYLIIILKVYGLVHPVHLSIICHLFGPGNRKFFGESLPRGVGHLQIKSSRSCQRCSFFNISLKNMPIQIALDISI